MAQKTVAIIGASTNRAKFGNKSVRAHVNQGWKVYPVNPRAETIEGLAAYKSLTDVPTPIDRVSLYLPPKLGIDILPQIAAVKPAEFFVNPGAESAELVEKARELGLDPIIACSIVDLGVSPGQLDA